MLLCAYIQRIKRSFLESIVNKNMESSLARVGIPCFCCCCRWWLDLFFEFLLLKDVESHVEDGWVVEDDDAPVGPWLNVYSHVNAEVIV